MRCTNLRIFIVLFVVSCNLSTFLLSTFLSCKKSLSLADRSWTHYIVLHKPPTFPELATATRRLYPISLVPQNFGTFFWQISQYIIMILQLSFSWSHSLAALIFSLNFRLFSFHFFSTHLFYTSPRCCSFSRKRWFLSSAFHLSNGSITLRLTVIF